VIVERSPRIHASWQPPLAPAFAAPQMAELRAFLVEERRSHAVHPPMNEVFAAFDRTPFDRVRVVILGQDPYHGPGQAHGLCFSVRRGVPPPPSLQNIFKEIRADLGFPLPSHGDLGSWADQGVLLLNAVLTVRQHAANSHAARGWEPFTDAVVEALGTQREGLVFLLWGAAAQKKAARIDRRRHHVLTAPHPSPLSASSGFFGCRHFSRTNAWLAARGEAPIDWSLPA
jgi:uracil-DNA glycosylase